LFPDQKPEAISSWQIAGAEMDVELPEAFQ
jgi:hypothetical protein